MIDERPAVVEDRSRLGDFEGDLIVGRNGLSAIGALVDRTTRLVRLIHLPNTRHSEATAAAIIAAVADLPMRARKTLIWDQGTEMARYDLIPHLFPDGIFFANPGSPWQRGSNENMDGLLRQYFPRSVDLRTAPSTTSAASRSCSTTAPARSLAGQPQPPRSPHYWDHDQ